jgi:hypothetical protein
MDSCLFRVKPDDERPQVVAELASAASTWCRWSKKASWSAA